MSQSVSCPTAYPEVAIRSQSGLVNTFIGKTETANHIGDTGAALNVDTLTVFGFIKMCYQFIILKPTHVFKTFIQMIVNGSEITPLY